MNLHESAVEKYRVNTFIPPEFVHLTPELMDPEVWGPHFWFFIQTVAHTYPETPTAVTKRKYYDFIQNLPLFIPNPKIGDQFSSLLDSYPVSPYLDSRESFIRWIHFIHNKINILLNKEEISLFAALDNYRNHYKTKHVKLSERYHIRQEYVFTAITIICFVVIFMFYQ